MPGNLDFWLNMFNKQAFLAYTYMFSSYLGGTCSFKYFICSSLFWGNDPI